jgi:hypothetical protein
LKNSAASRCVAIIVAQQPTETISTNDRTALAALLWFWSNTLIAEALVIPLGVIMHQILLDDMEQQSLAQHEHLIQGFLLEVVYGNRAANSSRLETR